MFVLFNTVLASGCSSSFPFPYTFQNQLYSLYKENSDGSLEISLYLQINWERTGIAMPTRETS